MANKAWQREENKRLEEVRKVAFNAEDLISSTFRGFARDFADMIVPMQKLEESVTEREFHAILALAIFGELQKSDGNER